MKKYIKLLTKVLVSILLFFIILRNVNISTVKENFLLMDKNYLYLLVFLLVLNYVVSSFRWKQLLIHENTSKVTVLHLTSLYFVGSFFNNFMPTSIGGDVYKIYALGKKIKNNADAFTATFMERFSGVLALVLISYFGLIQTYTTLIQQLPAFFTSNHFILSLSKFLIFFGFWIITAFMYFSFVKLSKKIPVIKKIYDSFLVYKNNTRVLGLAFLTSFLVQFIAIFTQYFVFKSLGVDLPLWFSLFTFPVITLLGFFIPSLNGIGVQDALYMQLFSLIGVPTELSLSASIIYHLLRLFVSLFGGVIYVFNKTD